ncbi:F0F1 ATP synthase subunit B [uncultured Thomasclavelia sp.]|uniref:F0F1 ATP synthase subunit B n=1 Tax=uncultured Thomasclavelia sp. TaxID=3025759 RepID=UPI0025F462B5|nr:F0F1 ATP synthase subunit B [uncultured Thomasclavelia sp.]
MGIDIAGKLFPNITTLVVQLLATGVMLLIFKKFLWKPVQDYFAKRAEYIESTMTDAATMKDEAKKFVEESEKQARDAAVQYQTIVNKAKDDANVIKQNIIDEANQVAKAKMEQANREIEYQKEAAKAEIREEIVNVAIDVATKVMEKEIDTDTNRAMIDEFVDDVVN